MPQFKKLPRIFTIVCRTPNMARIRTIKPGFFKNEDLAELPVTARLLFIGLWTMADRRGRLEDRPKRIKAEIFPYDNAGVEDMLIRLQNAGFIKRYEVGDLKVIQILTFEEHQRITGTEAQTDSRLPEMPATIDGNNLETLRNQQGPQEGKGLLGKDIEEGKGLAEIPASKKNKAEMAWENCTCVFSAAALERWKTLCDQKKWKGKEQDALDTSLKKLMKYDEAFAVDLIDNAIGGGYQGVTFPDTDEKYKKFKNGTNKQTHTGAVIASGSREYGQF